MSKTQISIPSAPRLFNLGHPFPGVDEVASLCAEIVRDLHEFQILQQEAAELRGKLEVHDSSLRDHNRIMYYAAFRHFDRKSGSLLPKIEKTLLEKIDQLRESTATLCGLSVVDFITEDAPALTGRIKEHAGYDVDEFDVRDFRCNVPLIMTFRSECLSAFHAIGEAHDLPGPSNIVRTNKGSKDAISQLDFAIGFGVLGAHRVWLRKQRKGRAARYV